MTYQVVGQLNQPPVISNEAALPEGPVLDTIVVGGGLSGLAALWKLKNRHAKLLEWSPQAGGLAANGHGHGLTYARGAAYFTHPEGEVGRLYHELGLGRADKLEIPQPVDSYLEDHYLIRNVWEEGLQKLPEEFRRFKAFVEKLSEEGKIGDAPLEECSAEVQAFDHLTAAQLIAPFGPRVKAFLDCYCRSALGAESEQLSAMAFLNFYVDEFGERYAFRGGTGGVAEQLERKIRRLAPHAIQTKAFVYDVHHRADGLVEVRYQQANKNHTLLAKKVIMALPLSATAQVVRDLPQSRKESFGSLEHANYLVHNIFTPEVVFDQSYDTWVKGASFSDIIVGRWQQTHGYHTKKISAQSGSAHGLSAFANPVFTGLSR